MKPTLISSHRRHPARTDRRDLWFLWAVIAHAPVVAGIGFLVSPQETWWHITGEAIVPAGLAVVAYRFFGGYRNFRVIGAVLLMTYSGTLIHLGGGLIEWHFHVFVSLALLILYYDWLPIVVAADVIAGHHIILNDLIAVAVFKDGKSYGIVALHAIFGCYPDDWLRLPGGAPAPQRGGRADGTSEQVGRAALESAGFVKHVNEAVQSVAHGALVTSRSAHDSLDVASRFAEAIATLVGGAPWNRRCIK